MRRRIPWAVALFAAAVLFPGWSPADIEAGVIDALDDARADGVAARHHDDRRRVLVVRQVLAGPGAHRDHEVQVLPVVQPPDDLPALRRAPGRVPVGRVVAVLDELDELAVGALDNPA